MLGIQAPRSFLAPILPLSPPQTLDRPSSRDHLLLRSLNCPPRSHSSRPGSWSEDRPAGKFGSKAMSNGYGAVQQLSHYGSGTYGSAMNGISNQKAVNNTSSWSNFQSDPAHHNTQNSLPASQAQSRAASPEFETQPSYNSDSYGNSKGSSNNAIHPYLRLPPTISPSGGSISEFAAQTTCLFWFESSPTLYQIEDISRPLPCRTLMCSEAQPTTGFLKWVTTILSTTQVTQNVIILALLFIHRLKKQNPTVKGKLGSEYRLLTVALMLGNKFLDDNTYTNKTWAEVSGISVSEIHVMEVEFLSHMKYNLYTSKEEWMAWHKKLAHLWKFFNVASIRIPDVQARASHSSYKPPMLEIPRTLPSPPSSNNASSPPYPMSVSPNYPTHPNNVGPILPHPVPSQISPTSTIAPMDHPFTRKRSYDEAAHDVEPPSKRQYNYEAYHASRASTPVQALTSQNNVPNLANLPAPHLPIPGQMSRSNGYAQAPTPASNNLNPNQTLPPAGNWHPSVSSQPGDNRSLPALHVATGGHIDRLRHDTPLSSISRHASPVAPSYASSAATHNAAHSQLSPSVLLHQRSSPYRPVRNITTLLVPPPSGPLRNPPQHLPDEQMYWQPIGRQSVRKTGRLPYDHHEAWPETHQYQHWPTNYNAPRS